MNQDDSDFRDDEKVLENIRRTQEDMKEPVGLEMIRMIDKVMEDSRPILRARAVFRNTLRSIVKLGHEDLSFWKRVKLGRSLKHTLMLYEHIRGCDKCKIIFNEFVRQIEVINSVETKISYAKKTD
jgi:hypothetical protein